MKTRTIIHWSARIISIAAIVFVSLFALDSFATELSLKEQLVGFAIHMIPSFVLLAILIVAWKWELAGGIIYVLIGLVLSPLLFVYNYRVNHSVGISLSIILLITFPFLLAGVLFIMSHIKMNRFPESNQDSGKQA